MSFFYRNRKDKNPKIHMEAKMLLNRQSDLKKNSIAAGITISNLQLYYRAKSTWFWHKNRHYRPINSCSYSLLILNKDAKNVC
jgi:hypothetical protein